MNLNQLKLEVHDTYKKYEKLTTNFEAVNDEDVMNKAYLDTNLSKIQSQISYIEKDYSEFKLHYKEDLLIERAATTSIQNLYDTGLYDNYNNGNAHEVLKEYLLVEINDRRRPDSEKLNDVIQCFCS